MVISEDLGTVQRIRLVPNRSATWKQTMCVIGAIGGLSLMIAIFWAFMGAWVILPFAGIEVALLVFFSYRVCSESYHQEVIHLSEGYVDVEWGKGFPKRRWRFERQETEFLITRPRHSLSAAAVELVSGAEELRLGRKLNSDDIDELIELIRVSKIPYRFEGKTTTVAIEGFDLS